MVVAATGGGEGVDGNGDSALSVSTVGTTLAFAVVGTLLLHVGAVGALPSKRALRVVIVAIFKVGTPCLQ